MCLRSKPLQKLFFKNLKYFMQRLETTPLPLLKVIVSCSMVFCNTFMMTSLLPFLTFLIDDFKVAPTPDDIGQYSGYLVAAFMLGQLLFSYSWGVLSDVYGRRPVMLIGLFLTGWTFVSFGFSKTYTVAIILRFLNGSVNGIIGITKTYLSEITDETNQGKAFSYFGVARGLGMVVGPIVGGFLCLPAEKYPSLFPKGSLFDQFGYLLPCVVGWLIAMFGCLVGFFVLEETNQNVIKKSLAVSSESDPESRPLLEECPTTVREPKKFKEMIESPKVLITLVLYTLISFTYIQFDELFALWSRLPLDEGGLEFDSSEMGKAYAIGGISLFLYQMFLFSRIERYLGTLRTFQSGLLFSIPAFLILPLANKFENRVVVWVIIAFAQVFRACAGVQGICNCLTKAFTAVFIMVSNSITSESRGALNGTGQTLGSLGRMLGPVFAGITFSWSLENGLPFPVDYHFLFILLGMIVFAIFLVSLLVPTSIDQRSPEADPCQEDDDEHEQ